MKRAAVLTAMFVWLGCGEIIEVDDRPAQVTGAEAALGVEVSGELRFVDVVYTLRDYEGDDVDLNVQVCDAGGRCGAAWQAPGGDGTYRVPTEPFDTDVPHVFRWDVGCGRAVGASVEGVGLTDELRLKIGVVGSDSSAETPVFTLETLGFEAIPECASGASS